MMMYLVDDISNNENIKNELEYIFSKFNKFKNKYKLYDDHLEIDFGDNKFNNFFYTLICMYIGYEGLDMNINDILYDNKIMIKYDNILFLDSLKELFNYIYKRSLKKKEIHDRYNKYIKELKKLTIFDVYSYDYVFGYGLEIRFKKDFDLWYWFFKLYISKMYPFYIIDYEYDIIYDDIDYVNNIDSNYGLLFYYYFDNDIDYLIDILSNIISFYGFLYNISDNDIVDKLL